MTLSERFKECLRKHREQQGLSQDRVAELSGLDRTYISQLERGLKSPTLTTIEKLADCLSVAATDFFSESSNQALASRSPGFVMRPTQRLTLSRKRSSGTFSSSVLTRAIDTTHELIDRIYGVDLDIAAILGMRNLSAFVGEVFATAVVKTSAGLFRANPHQDGYPDLLFMDAPGRTAWSELAGRENDKAPFSPFKGGGIEIKATCGSVPTPAICRKRGFARPDLGDQRITCLTGYDWKAHHRDTNNLVGLIWDFLQGRPRAVAMFYSSDVKPSDWGAIVQPKAGGGRTTSVSIMGRTGICKMAEGWLCVRNEPAYIEFLNARNPGLQIPVD